MWKAKFNKHLSQIKQLLNLRETLSYVKDTLIKTHLKLRQ